MPAEVEALFEACPVTVVPAGTDPALVLALLADPVHHQARDRYADHWMQGQRDRLLRRGSRWRVARTTARTRCWRRWAGRPPTT